MFSLKPEFSLWCQQINICFSSIDPSRNTIDCPISEIIFLWTYLFVTPLGASYRVYPRERDETATARHRKLYLLIVKWNCIGGYYDASKWKLSLIEFWRSCRKNTFYVEWLWCKNKSLWNTLWLYKSINWLWKCSRKWFWISSSGPRGPGKVGSHWCNPNPNNLCKTKHTYTIFTSLSLSTLLMSLVGYSG